MYLRRIAALMTLLCSAACGQALLDNNAIGKLVKSGIGEQTIVSMINEQPGRYTVSADDLMALKSAGVSEKILAAMVVRAGAAPATVPAAAPASAPTSLVLRDATPIRLRLMRELNFTNVKPGDMVAFEIQDDIRIDGLLVTTHGMRSTATITQAEPKTRMGRGGKLGVRLTSIPLLNGDKLPVRVTRLAARVDAAADTTPDTASATAAPDLLYTIAKGDALPDNAEITVFSDGETRLDPTRFLVDIDFTSTPAGALVTMYGTPVGRTPFTTRLAQGAYKITFSLDGYYDLKQTLKVGPGQPSTAHAAFEMK